ncbi:unnamed protein product (macronuclear) [Paramecium tetraurelia]|uniref:Cyclin N-terminal domain-containing protein n=1 Tax=Paramecium tetraurelia TaxID=5888 RepID=A0BCM8_PARTE|nr:uncharacterized protein GSPATT00004389001 [Paramecium tetraurelia]CAK56295.1 unnamed protein product [Paramecium tetraurelia]|eukprot:XP_001423693.1 hypothetical protein (macronuclear) [Paramecium tetraurelia strain d4-2]
MQNSILINELNAREKVNFQQYISQNQSRFIINWPKIQFPKEIYSFNGQYKYKNVISFKKNTFQHKISLKTIELAVLYIDIYLNAKNISEQKFQLLAICSFNLAAKFNQKGITQQTKILDSNGIGIYQDHEYDEMEIELLQAMQFQLNFITSSDYAELIGLNLQDEKIKSYFLFILVGIQIRIKIDFQIYKYQHLELALAILFLSDENAHQLQPRILQISKVIQDSVNQYEKMYEKENQGEEQCQSNLNKSRRIKRMKPIRKLLSKQVKQKLRQKY